MNSPTSSILRASIIEAIRLDLVGPDNAHPFARELLRDAPTRWYLTGYLVPTDAPTDQKVDDTSDEQIDSGEDGTATDEGQAPDRDAARKRLLPSSMGISVLLPATAQTLDVLVEWGDYAFEGGAEDADAGKPDDQATACAVAGAGALRGFRRTPREELLSVPVPTADTGAVEHKVPNSGGLAVVITARCMPVGDALLPAGTRSLSVFLVNQRPPRPDKVYRTCIFQAKLVLKSADGFVARPDLRGSGAAGWADEWDERVGDLQYRDCFEFSVGHGVSTAAVIDGAEACHCVSTEWIPSAEVERVAPSTIPDAELGMEALGALESPEAALANLMPLVTHYRAWIEAQKRVQNSLSERRAETATELLLNAAHMAQRIQAGIESLRDPMVFESFRIANRTMGRAARQRESAQRSVPPEEVPAPRWRPFQLAFILISLRGMADPLHPDRGIVDLLFFPTGGGKTEAYLGLAAFTMVLRRLRNPGLRSSGMSVLMRYTLRLLTLDQLGRAAALMCALELEREQDTRLGTWPFEIGLWVGSAATPNRMGYEGYDGPGKDNTAYIRTRRFAQDSGRHPAPIPLENCPWCGTKFGSHSFRLVPNPKRPLDLRVHCQNHNCLFSGDRALPILGVDEPIYRRIPAFVIATVDKFAALPWVGNVGMLFGLVDGYDDNGFYGPCGAPGSARDLGGPLLPPDLIIQDELHLISGPLGTIAGVYECAIDELASRKSGGSVLRPKVVASTATVRRADSQIRALFNRHETAIFPPPGPDRRDSFFAFTEPATVTPARLYLGIAAQGRSLKVVLLRAALAIMSAAQNLYEQAGGRKNKANPADPYMTLLGYFNSLRELGGSRRIVEDEVRTRLGPYGRRRRLDPVDALFTDRTIQYDVLELTSRVSTSEVAQAKRRLALPFYDKDRVDVALATNMISVGLDIIRLGLMVVLGQPKTSAEYIQATSRVGRDPTRPGLVVTLLNIHKPRDRSHYERFAMYHGTFYRAVEATSITPFSPRALDRALAGALVGLCRHGDARMTQPLGAGQILALRSELDQFAQSFAERASSHRVDIHIEQAERLRAQVMARCRGLLDDWLLLAMSYEQNATSLQYEAEVGNARRLLYEFLHPDLPTLRPEQLKFRANRSMRDVEASVEVVVKNLNDWADRR